MDQQGSTRGDVFAGETAALGKTGLLLKNAQFGGMFGSLASLMTDATHYDGDPNGCLFSKVKLYGLWLGTAGLIVVGVAGVAMGVGGTIIAFLGGGGAGTGVLGFIGNGALAFTGGVVFSAIAGIAGLFGSWKSKRRRTARWPQRRGIRGSRRMRRKGQQVLDSIWAVEFSQPRQIDYCDRGCQQVVGPQPVACPSLSL